MTPTNELRFVRRMVEGNESKFERTILQQKWTDEDAWGKVTEQWRDVPLVEEKNEQVD